MNTTISKTTIVPIAAAVAVALAVGSGPVLAKGKGGPALAPMNAKGKGGPHGKGPHMGFGRIYKALKAFGDELDLSQYQKSEIKEKVEACRKEVKPLKKQIKTLHKELFDLLKAKKLSKTKIKAKHKQIDAVQDQIAEKKLDTAIEVLEVLSDDQRQELFSLVEKCKGKMCQGDCPCPDKGKGKGKGKSKAKGW
jgi:Spy/CpxP family protein refolding chaperone